MVFEVSVFIFIVEPILIVFGRFVGEIVLPSDRFVELIILLPLNPIELIDQVT